MREVVLAENAGFCFGVKRATDALEKLLKDARPGEKIYTLGNLIHNEVYNASLRERGVSVTSAEELSALAKNASESAPVTVLVRAHGCRKETYAELSRLAEENPCFKWVDCTCPYVKKVHKIASECDPETQTFFLMGAENHPEVVGIMSFFDGEKHTFSSPEALEATLSAPEKDNLHKKTPVMASQTTFNLVNWYQSQEILKKLYTNFVIFDTICSVTELRQKEASDLSGRCDGMIVIGGRESSNTAKLYAVCKENCPNTVWIARASELEPERFSGTDRIGIVAGASTPSGEIQEVYQTMSEIKENFEELLESQCKTLNTGDVVTGTVTNVTDAELQLDVGAGVTGYIKAEQITDDPAFKLTENFKVGDEVRAFVIRVSDIEGIAELSKKRVDADENWYKVVAACEDKTVLEGKVTEAVKGGVVIHYDGNRVFVPGSQTGVPKDGDLSTLVGTTAQFRVIEVKPGKKAIGSIRSVLRDARKAQEVAFWENIEVGKVYNGVVKSMTSYGAFVDLGGVDGMVHTSELSWKHIKSPAEVVSVGQNITVFVKSFDPEKKRISLGYKTEESNPWNIFKSKYAVGDIVSVKIVNMMPFGAFAEIIDGVDGLIHISQIAMQRIAKPADILEIGQVVDARITEIDDEKKKISLSIRSLLEEAAQAAEAMPEEAAEEAPAEEVAPADEQ